MTASKNARRQFVKTAAAGFGLLPLSYLANAQKETPQADKKKIVCVGGHPDDPESGCGGTLAKLVNAGHDVSIIYLTTGEAGIEGKSHNEAAAIRKQESLNACAILKTKPIFAGQIDGDTVVNNDWFIKMQQLLSAEAPDIVFTHWPLDTHKDHRAACQLTLQAWLNPGKPFDLYFFEVCMGEQTMLFRPTDYVDITDTQAQKKKAVYCHTSQDPPGIYGCGHADMEVFRGRESGFHAAEAFVKMTGRGNAGLVGV